MYFERNRHVLIINHLLESEGKPLTSEMLAVATQVSSRTIKSDMAFVDEILRKNGAKLSSVKGKGYSITIVDEPKFDTYRKGALTLKNNYPKKMDREFIRYCIYVGRTLLSARGYVDHRKLESDLVITDNLFKQICKKTTEIIESYHLIVENKKNVGYIVHGPEHYKRMCMLAFFGVRDEEYPKNFVSTEFENWFAADQKQMDYYFSLLKDKFNEYNLPVKLSALLGYRLYIPLMINRQSYGYNVELANNEKNKIKGFAQYECAKDILETVSKKANRYIATDDEICFLATQILAYQDFDAEEINEEVLPGIYPKIMMLNREVNEYLLHRWGIDLIDDEDMKNALLPSVSRSYIRSYLNFCPFDEIILQSVYEAIDKSPVSVYIASDMMNYLETLLGAKYSEKDVYYAAHFISYALKNMKFGYNKRNVMLVFALGVNVSKLVRKQLMAGFGEFINKVDVFEPYQLRGMDFSEYDCLLTDVDNSFDLFQKDKHKISTTHTRSISEKLINNLFVGGYDVDGIVEKLASITNLFSDCQCNDHESFVDLLAIKNSDNDVERKEIKNSFKRIDKRLDNRNHDNFVCYLSNYTNKKECVNIYKFTKPIRLGKSLIQYGIHINYDFSSDRLMLSAINRIIEQINEEKGLLNKLLDSGNAQECLKSALIDSFKI